MGDVTATLLLPTHELPTRKAALSTLRKTAFIRVAAGNEMGADGLNVLMLYASAHTLAPGVPVPKRMSSDTLSSSITYWLMMDDDSVSLDILFGTGTPGANVWADAYSINTFNPSAPISFPAATLMNAVFLNVDSAAFLVGSSCVGNSNVAVTSPTCAPRPFNVFPAGYTPSSVCASSGSASPIVTDTYNSSTYNYQVGLATDVVRLIPTFVTQTQTIVAVSFLAHPQTSATTTFTMRPAVYVQTGIAATFTLIAQAAQTTIPGSTLAGNFTYLYFPLQTPVTVQAGTTIYINRLVDQPGLVMAFDESGQTYTASTAIYSNQSAPTTLQTSGTGGVDASRGLLGCPATASTPPSGSVCSGPAVMTGPVVSPPLNTYSGPSEFVGSQRTVTTTQQVLNISMTLYYTVATPNPSPIQVSYALYGPPSCGVAGDSLLLGTTVTYTYPANYFTQQTAVVLSLALSSPVVIAPGTYWLMMDDDSVSLDILFGTGTPGANVWADAYSINTFNPSAPISFPAATLMNAVFLNVDSAAFLVGSSCVGNSNVAVTSPTCAPRPFNVFPAGYTPSSVCASSGSASPIVTDTYNSSTYNYQVGLATDVVRLIPTFVTQTQTIVAVSFLAHPQTSATTTFTMRPAVYVQTGIAATFTLIAQAAQTTIPGSTLAGNFTYLYFPLQTPVTVQAGTTIYINRLVDQPGLVMAFDESGQTYTASTAIYSNQSAPTTLQTSGTGGVDASRGLLGCPATASTPPSGSVCSGPAVMTGPVVSPPLNTYSGPSEFVGSQRTVTTTQQVLNISMTLYYTVATPNPSPIQVSYALYGPPSCGVAGDSLLLGTTVTYTYPANYFTQQTAVVLSLALSSPVVIAPGTYWLMMDDDSVSLDILFGTGTPGANVWADAYSINTFNPSAPISFPAATLMNAVFLNVDSAAFLVGSSCVGNSNVAVTSPTCAPRPFNVFPAGYTPSSVCASSGSASPIVTDTYNSSTYNYQVGLATDVVRLIPTFVTQTQTIVAVSFLAHPQTSATTTFTMRPAVYVQTGIAATFTLIAQAAQTTIPGSTLAGNFTYLYFPLQTPVTVQAGTTIYINRLVDQPGLVMAFDESGQTYTASTAIYSNQSAPTTLQTSGTGGVDASRGLLGCPTSSTPIGSPSSSTAGPAASSSAAYVTSTSATSTVLGTSSSAATGTSVPVSSGGGGGSSLSGGAIAGIVIGSVVGLVLLLGLCLAVLLRSPKRKQATTQRLEDDHSQIGNSTLESRNNTNMESGEVEMH